VQVGSTTHNAELLLTQNALAGGLLWLLKDRRKRLPPPAPAPVTPLPSDTPLPSPFGALGPQTSYPPQIPPQIYGLPSLAPMSPGPLLSTGGILPGRSILPTLHDSTRSQVSFNGSESFNPFRKQAPPPLLLFNHPYTDTIPCPMY